MSLRKLKQKLATPIVAITLLGSSWNGNFFGNACFAEEWGRFRGTNGTGVAGELHLVDGISDEVLRWKRELPAGTSSPVQSGKPFKVLRTHSLEEPIVAPPSISDGQLYIRSESQLFCFGTKG